MKDLNKVIKFIKLLQRLQLVKRTVLVDKKTRWENDNEHSFQLAMVAWYIASSLKLRLNLP